MANEELLELQFRQLNYNHKDNFGNIDPILINTSGKFRSGCLTGIIGPPGAGKSTLLSILAGFKSSLKLTENFYINFVPRALRRNEVSNKEISGHILINGRARELRSFRKISSYIDKISATLCLLTVQETLQFSADLKLPRTTSNKQKQLILDNIVELLDLQYCREKLVRDISGGEHKRLSVGIELITDPRIIFYDEPTSGLDNISSIQIMGCLQRLAHQGRIVVCVINQSCSHLMNFFDDILVLSQGEVLYSGPQSDMVESFKTAGFTSPQFDNAADFSEQWEESESSKQHCKKLIIQNKERHYSPHAPVDEKTSEIDLMVKIDPRLPHKQVDFWYTLYVLVKRQLLCTSRNMISELKRILFRFIVAILLGIVYYMFRLDIRRPRVICQFYLVYGNIIRSVMFLMKDYPLVNREYCNGCYSRTAYYISKGIADFPMQLIWSILLVILRCSMSDRSFGSHLSNIYQFGLLTSLMGFIIGVVGWSLISMFFAISFSRMIPPSSAPFLFIYTLFIRKFPFLPNPQNIINSFKRPVFYYRRVKMLLATEMLYMKFFGHFFKVFEETNNDLNWELMTIALTVIFGHISIILA